MAKKNISDDLWAIIKGKYVSGSLPIYKIAQVHDIHKKTIERRAKKEKWIYGAVSNNVSKEVEKATIETIVKGDIDKAVKITETFIKDSSNIRGVTMAIMKAMSDELMESGGNMSTAEANRLIACQKVSEIASKTIAKLYDETRKALGMDKDEDIRKAREIQANDKAQEVLDPLAGKTLSEVKEELEKLRNR